ncbi:hypothetical protein Tco_0080755, partial [Tanacetum coccineum]
VMPYQRLLVIRQLQLLRGHLARDVDPHQYPYLNPLEDGYVPYVPREVGLGVDIEDSYEPTPSLISTLTFMQILMSVLRMLMLLEVEGWMIEMWLRLRPRKRSSLERDTVEVEINPRVRPAIEDDVRESVREDVLNHVTPDGVVEVTYETLGGLVQRFHDHAMEIPIHQIQVIENEQRLQGHRITRVDLEVTTMTEKISALEQDNTRLRGMLDVESQRVDQLQCGLSRAQREMRQMRHFRFYDRVRLGR